MFVCSYHEPLRSTILPLVGVLKTAGDLQPLVILEEDTAARMQRTCAAADVAFRHFSDRRRRARSTVVPPWTPTHAADTHDLPRSPRVARHGMVRRVLRCGHTVWKLRRQIRRRVSLLRQARAEVLILLDDRTLHGCRWVRAAHEWGIPVVVVQWAATHRASTMAALRSVRQGQGTASGSVARFERFTARRVPNAAKVVDGRRVWWIPPEVTLAYYWLGAYPKVNPWTYGGGNADVVTVLGEAWKRRFAADGVAADKLVVTGHPEQDIWHQLAAAPDRDRSRDVARDLGIAAGKRLITVIAPAMVLREPGGARHGDIAVSDLRHDLDAAVRVIRDLGDPYVPVVKVHPRDKVEALAFLGRGTPTPPVIVGDYPPDRLIAASCAMACQWSTAAMIGQALAVPVVVFDFHQSPSAHVWAGVDGLHHAQSVEQFDAMLRRCLHSAAARRRLLVEQRRFVDHYLRLDGKARDRIAALIRQQARQGLKAAERP